MTEKITKTIIKAIVVVILATLAMTMTVLYDYFEKVQFANLGNQLALAEIGLEQNGLDYFEDFNSADYRITVIDIDGVVLLDSQADISSMENHGDREEVTEAKTFGYGSAERISSTMAEKTFYVASELENGWVLRVSATGASVLALLLGLLQPLLAIGAVGIILAFALARILSKKITEPINQLNLDAPLEKIEFQELSPLLIQMEKKNSKTKLQIADLKQKNQEITYVIENVSDGILVLNELGMILTANKMAKQLLNCKEDSFYLDSFRDINYRDVVQSALSGTNLAKSVAIGEKVYRFSASTTDSDMNKFAVFLFISDITEEEKSLELRRQFTANVSHELKTPLSSIMGSAEIMANGIAKVEDCPHFAKKIYDEANRLLKLIQDIIKISTMDEGQIAYDFEEVDFALMCQNVQAALTTKAQKLDVELLVDLPNKPVSVCGYQQIICDLAYNLCDNAINYNKAGGAVTLKVSECEKSVTLQVIDTGIGIGHHLPS